jgi:hypothetical protein
LRLIEINGVLFAVLQCRVQRKRHRPYHDKTSGLSFDAALCPHEYKKLTSEMNKKREKKKILAV